MPSVRQRMVGMEGYQWFQYCQLADKGWLLDKSNNTMGFLVDEDIHCFAICWVTDWPHSQTKEFDLVLVYTCASLHIHSLQRVVCHVLFAGTCAVRHVNTVQELSHISGELTINTLVTFSAHTSSVSLTICCHMLYPCMLFFRKVEGLS